MRWISFGYILLAVGNFGLAESKQDRPNILWITAEDMSPTLGCYGDDYAVTPNIDALAQQSVKYTHAFATAPVCSPARSCLITGCYTPSLGTQHMRSAFPLPDFIHGFPKYLRDAGYYTTNNSKTDYNTSSSERLIEESWNESSDEAHWRKRPDGQPFFSIFNLMTSHQSRTMVWPYEQFQNEVQSRLPKGAIHDPEQAPVPPYYPDTPLIRREIARYYDCVSAMDLEVGAILKQLEEDGLADNTIVFFYSDHGSGMPRHKRTLLDTGMHVPLLIRFPEKYQHLAPAEPGETVDRLVSFVDFAPTMLSLLGIERPDYMQGLPFLGTNSSEVREYAFGHRDRVDEAIDLARSVRDQRFLLIRNYMPHLSYNQPTSWPDQGDIRHEFYRLADREKMTDAQWHFAGPTRAPVEFYDCENDPLNLNNLADDPAYSEELIRLKEVLNNHLNDTLDTGFIPEPVALEYFTETNPWEDRNSYTRMIGNTIAYADFVGRDKETPLLEIQFPAGRYWETMCIAASPRLESADEALLKSLLKDESPIVRITAASTLLQRQESDLARVVLLDELHSQKLIDVLYTARAIEMLGEKGAFAVPAMRGLAHRMQSYQPDGTTATFVQSGDADLAMFIGFAITGFLNRVDNGEWISLFNGESLDHWEARAKGDVTVEDGEIRILSKGQNLWLVHNQEFADFELSVEVDMPVGGYNSGIGFRCTGDQGRPTGYQCEVENLKTGMIYAIGSGWVWPKSPVETIRFRQMAGNCFKPGEWNLINIRCEGDHIQIWVNGVQTADVTDDRFAKGFFALQHHGKGDVHRFRNIQLRNLTSSNGSAE